MTNKLNEKRSNAVIVAAVVAAFIYALIGLTIGLALGLKKSEKLGRATDPSNLPHMLLIDAADGLRHTTAALTLCNEKEPCEALMRAALVYSTRAETALECDGCDCLSSRQKEAFLNDASSLFGGGDSKAVMDASDALYKYSAMLYRHATNGETFEYDGALERGNGSIAFGKTIVAESSAEKSAGEPDEGEIARARELVEKTLGASDCLYIGGYDGRVEFDLKRGKSRGYAVVKGERIIEFAFSAGETGDGTSAEGTGSAADIALKTARECGFDGLSVFETQNDDRGAMVLLCRNIDGAYCRNECARAVVSGGRAVAFSAGDCTKSHELPQVKVGEEEARANAPKGSGAGRLVTTFDGERDRVCYEYRIELDDGVHYVRVCAENGKQMSVE